MNHTRQPTIAKLTPPDKGSFQKSPGWTKSIQVSCSREINTECISTENPEDKNPNPKKAKENINAALGFFNKSVIW